MYASKRTVRKAQGIEKKGKEPKHGNGKITRGREFRIQLIKDEHGFVKKRIVHYSPRKLKQIAEYQKMLAEYKAAMITEQQKQLEGENDVTGMEAKPAEKEPATEIVEVPENALIATE